MALIRLISYAIIIWIAWFFIKNYLAKQGQQNRQKNQSTKASANAAKKSPKKVVKCRYCDVHLPQDLAIQVDNDFFCNEKHRQSYLNQD